MKTTSPAAAPPSGWGVHHFSRAQATHVVDECATFGDACEQCRSVRKTEDLDAYVARLTASGKWARWEQHDSAVVA